jgi:hypothetical protein
MGRLALVSGDLAAARALCSESLTLRREMNDPQGIAACRDELARQVSAHKNKRRTPSNPPSTLSDPTRDQSSPP